MSFVYPLGLLGLIGIPILIIIYIIKSKYTEQTIASTYIWNLSERFLKVKKPISKVSGIVSLILQILAVLIISLSIAHPVIKLPNAAHDYCFILDASGSMNTMQGDISRLDLGKKEIESLIKKSSNGSSYTLIYVGDVTRVVYENLEDKEQACLLLNHISTSYISANCKNSLVFAQEFFNENPSILTYLVTDRDYETSNIELINVVKEEVENYAILDMNYNIETNVEDNVVVSRLAIIGHTISYKSDVDLTLELFIDDAFVEEQSVHVGKGEKTEFKFSNSNVNFQSIKVNIKNADALKEDNVSIIYNVIQEHSYTTLLVSDHPFYLKSIIDVVGNTSIDVLSSEEYNKLEINSGYGLYIYDGITPKALPTDGAIWLFNITESMQETGFSVQAEKDLYEDKQIGELVYPKASSSLFKRLVKGTTGSRIYVAKYMKYGLYRNFTTLLTCNDDPVVFAGTNAYGNREIVFAFDLHNSNLTMLPDYQPLFKNFIEYSFPTILEKSNYTCGDAVEVNVVPNCKSIRVESPLGNVSYMDTSSTISEYKVLETGTYTLTIMVGDTPKVFSIYVSLPQEEGHTVEKEELKLIGEKQNNLSDGKYDKLIILFIVLAVIFVADWAVYCYEQYQLR